MVPDPQESAVHEIQKIIESPLTLHGKSAWAIREPQENVLGESSKIVLTWPTLTSGDFGPNNH